MKNTVIYVCVAIFISCVTIVTILFQRNKIEKISTLHAPSSWFDYSTTEAPSDISPFTDKNVSDTAFHFWAWQKFLSLTRSCLDKAPFEDLIQVDNYGNKIGSVIELNDSTQAGSDAVLYDKSNRAIYYTIHYNESMYAFQQKYQPVFASIINKFKKSVNNDSLIQREFNKLGLDTLNFPVGSYILKTSWILVSSLESTNGYYTTKGVMPLNNKIDTVEIALIGMHIIGRVYNHPEFIWATYEHGNLVPSYKWKHKGYPLLNEIISDKNYLFYDANTNFNNCPMNNVPCSPAQFTNIFNIYPNGMVKSFEGDMYPDKLDVMNDINVTSLTKSVHLQLRKSVWANYSYKGSVWLNAVNTNFGPGNMELGNLTNISLRGTRAISNITMETYTQLYTNGIYTGGSMNCFGCHGTSDFANPLDNGGSFSYNLGLSHSFRNGVQQRVARQ